MKIILVLFGISFGACYTSCILSGESRTPSIRNTLSPTPEASRETILEINERKKLWEGKRVDNYDMVLSYETTSFLEPAHKVEVRVRSGSAISVQEADPNDQRGRLAFYDPYNTVDRMFLQIDKLSRRPNSKVIVIYNDAVGYPEVIEYLEPNPDASFTVKLLKFVEIQRD